MSVRSPLFGTVLLGLFLLLLTGSISIYSRSSIDTDSARRLLLLFFNSSDKKVCQRAADVCEGAV